MQLEDKPRCGDTDPLIMGWQLIELLHNKQTYFVERLLLRPTLWSDVGVMMHVLILFSRHVV